MKRIYSFSQPAAHARRALLLLTGLALLSPLTGRGQVQTFTTNPPAPTELAFTATKTIGTGTVGYLKAIFPNAGVGMGAFGVRTNGFTFFNSTTGRLDFAAGIQRQKLCRVHLIGLRLARDIGTPKHANNLA